MKFSSAPKLALFFLLFFCLCAPVARADHPTLGFGPGLAGPIVTVSAVPLPKHRLAFDLRQELIRFDEFSDEQLLQFAAEEREVHSVGWLLTPSLGLAYGLSDDLTLGLRLPFVYRQGIREVHHEETETLGDPNGLGDLTAFGQYRFLHRPERALQAALLFGLQMPTGVDDRQTGEGEPFETAHQPGSGSWDPLFGLALTRQRQPVSCDVNVLYHLATEGSRKTDLGDSLLYNAALSWRLPETGHSHRGEDHHSHLAWDLILEANGEYRRKEEVAGVSNPESGGNLLYLSPGARLTAEGGLTASLSVGIPVWEDLNGKQSEPEYRLLFTVGAGI